MDKTQWRRFVKGMESGIIFYILHTFDAKNIEVKFTVAENAAKESLSRAYLTYDQLS